MPGRPYKVWNSDRTVRKSVVVDSFQALIEKGCKQLALDDISNVTVVLEEDGTEVYDEEYFGFLANQTTFIFLAAGETWHHPLSTADGGRTGQIDAQNQDDVEMDFVDSSSERITQLAERMHSDITCIATFTSADMELVTSEDPKRLGRLLNKSEKEAKELQTVCQRYLDDRREAREAMGLLNLVRQVQQQQSSNSTSSGGGEESNDNKRQRLE